MGANRKGRLVTVPHEIIKYSKRDKEVSLLIPSE